MRLSRNNLGGSGNNNSNDSGGSSSRLPYKQIGAIAVAAAILAAIFIPFQNVDAFIADLSLPDADPSDVPKSPEGSTFQVTIDIAPGELIPLSQIELVLDNDTPQVRQAIFDVTDGGGEYISGDSDLVVGNLVIDAPSSSSSYGYGYGYGSVSYGTSFSPPYSYSFTTSEDFISGNKYGYSYAVSNANFVNGFLGPATITIEGTLNTDSMDEGSHTLDVLVHTGSGGNEIDQIVPPQLAFTITEEEEEEDSPTLTIESADLDGNPITGMWTTIREADSGDLLHSGFTPLSFTDVAGEERDYVVTIANYEERTFDHWEDDSTSDLDWGAQRTISDLSEDLTITAFFNVGNFITVESEDTAGNPITGYWTVLYDGESGDVLETGFTPVTFSIDAGQEYEIGMGDYGDFEFDHWEDNGSTANPRSVTPEPGTTALTAVYVDTSVSPPPPSDALTLTVNALAVEDDSVLNMWTVIQNQETSTTETGFTPISVEADSGTTLEVTVHDYQDIVFSHWEDTGSTDRTRTITMTDADTEITAYYTTIGEDGNGEETIHMQDTTASAGYGVYEDKPARAEYVTPSSQLIGDQINSITLQLKSVGTISGTVEIGVFNDDLSVKELFGTLDVSTLTTTYTDYEFTLSEGELYSIEEGDRIGIKYEGGSGSDSSWVSVMLDLDPEDPFDGEDSYLNYYQSGAWQHSEDRDMYMILKQIEG